MSPRDLPPPLPPEVRTVGQVVAEALRLYGKRFLPALPLGLPLAVADLLSAGGPVLQRSLVLVVFAPLFSAAYVWAACLVSGRRPPARRLLLAVGLGTLVFVPAALLFPWFALLAVAWLALAGLVVPVVVFEDVPPLEALRRGFRLGRVDYVHALGSLATLAIVFVLSRLVLAFLLRSQADNTIRVAIFVADVVVSPILYLGAALLYLDQAARYRVKT
ncbi:MAG TPA: hypothetical protein VNT23_05345 [Gaiellaceae bacterium]|nr:hypothetical protein [Gaiellaceae bacterium]